jgi:hypothetical protein
LILFEFLKHVKCFLTILKSLFYFVIYLIQIARLRLYFLLLFLLKSIGVRLVKIRSLNHEIITKKRNKLLSNWIIFLCSNTKNLFVIIRILCCILSFLFYLFLFFYSFYLVVILRFDRAFRFLFSKIFQIRICYTHFSCFLF